MNVLQKPEMVVSLVTCLLLIALAIYFFKRLSEFESGIKDGRDDIDIIAKKMSESKLSDIATTRTDTDALFDTIKRVDVSLVKVKEVLTDLQLQREDDQQVLYEYSEQLQQSFKSVKEELEVPLLEFQQTQAKTRKQKRPQRFPVVQTHQRVSRPKQYQAPVAYQQYQPYPVQTRFEEVEVSEDEDAERELQNIRNNRLRAHA